MAEREGLEARIKALEDIEAIKQLKARYFRSVDSKMWDDLKGCFIEKASADYGLDMQFEDREAILDFLKGTIGQESFVSSHMGHDPEIELAGEASAKAIWSLNDYLTIGPDIKRAGWAFYEDEYVKGNDGWKIKSTKLVYIMEEWVRPEP